MPPVLVWGQAQVINGNRVHAGWINYGIDRRHGHRLYADLYACPPGYVTGQCFLFKPHLTNTGAATLNVQGLGAKALRKPRGSTQVPVVAGDLRANRLMQACYEGTVLQLMGAVPDAGDGTAQGIVCDDVTLVAAAIQQLLDTAPLGTRVELPAGSCKLEAPLTITRSVSLAGAGMDQTYLKQTVTNAPVLTVSVINVHVTGMTLMHATSAVAGGDGLIVRSPTGSSLQAVTITDVSASWNWRGFVLGCMAMSHVSQVWAQKNNSHGFEFLYEAAPGCGVDQWEIIQAMSQLNLGAGFFGRNTAVQPGIGPFLTQVESFGNNLGGYVFQGTPGHSINDLRLHNVLSSADNVHGIYLDTYGDAHLISQPWIELVGRLGNLAMGFNNTPSTASNTGHCLEVTANNGRSIAITGGLYWNCSWSGVALDAPYVSLTGGSSLGNGLALDATLARRAGVHVGASGVSVQGHTFTFPGTGTLHYLHLSGTLTDLAIGINAYDPTLATADMLSNQATLSGERRPTMLAGLSVHGPLEVRRADGSAVLQALSPTGTPSWPQRRGQVTIADTALSATVTLTPAEPDGLYFVQLTPVVTTGGAPTGAGTVTGVTKATGSFQVSVAAAPGAGRVVIYDWLVHR